MRVKAPPSYHPWWWTQWAKCSPGSREESCPPSRPPLSYSNKRQPLNAEKKSSERARILWHEAFSSQIAFTQSLNISWWWPDWDGGIRLPGTALMLGAGGLGADCKVKFLFPNTSASRKHPPLWRTAESWEKEPAEQEGRAPWRDLSQSLPPDGLSLFPFSENSAQGKEGAASGEVKGSSSLGGSPSHPLHTWMN